MVSRESQMAMVEDYSNMFEQIEINGGKGIRLKVLAAFQEQCAKAVLGV